MLLPSYLSCNSHLSVGKGDVQKSICQHSVYSCCMGRGNRELNMQIARVRKEVRREWRYILAIKASECIIRLRSPRLVQWLSLCAHAKEST